VVRRYVRPAINGNFPWALLPYFYFVAAEQTATTGTITTALNNTYSYSYWRLYARSEVVSTDKFYQQSNNYFIICLTAGDWPGIRLFRSARTGAA
jgi:hypothetical protein